jgi:hypothetical protein
MQRREERGPAVFPLLVRGKPVELKTLGCCRSYYDRHYRSLRFFGGLRERVLARDRMEWWRRRQISQTATGLKAQL